MVLDDENNLMFFLFHPDEYMLFVVEHCMIDRSTVSR